MRSHKVFLLAAILAIALGIATGVFLSISRTAQEESEAAATFGDARLALLIATTTAARERGLGMRDSLPSDTGMIFIFTKDGTYDFWMKDMRFPIDIFWLNSDRNVVHIERYVSTSTYPAALHSQAPARYVIETNAGFADEHHILLGTPLELKNIPTIAE